MAVPGTGDFTPLRPEDIAPSRPNESTYAQTARVGAKPIPPAGSAAEPASGSAGPAVPVELKSQWEARNSLVWSPSQLIQINAPSGEVGNVSSLDANEGHSEALRVGNSQLLVVLPREFPQDGQGICSNTGAVGLARLSNGEVLLVSAQGGSRAYGSELAARSVVGTVVQQPEPTLSANLQAADTAVHQLTDGAISLPRTAKLIQQALTEGLGLYGLETSCLQVRVDERAGRAEYLLAGEGGVSILRSDGNLDHVNVSDSESLLSNRRPLAGVAVRAGVVSMSPGDVLLLYPQALDSHLPGMISNFSSDNVDAIQQEIILASSKANCSLSLIAYRLPEA